MKKLFLLALLALLLVNSGIAKGTKTKVVTLATIHGLHLQSKYTYQDVIRAIDTYKPDLICLEIRPEEFRTKTYLQEMMYATAYGDLNKIAVAPIDWYTGDAKRNDRTIRDSLMKLDNYKAMQRQLDSLENASEIMKAFTAKYGQNIFQRKDLGFEFYNGDDFNGYNREYYRLSISIFGDSPVNLSAVTRNKKMTQRIIDAVKKYKAKRVVVLCGGEHKSIIEDFLNENGTVEVLSASSILPLNDYKLSDVMVSARPNLYFTKVDTAEANSYYSSMISPLLMKKHSMPSFSENDYFDLSTVGKVLQNWEKDVPTSATMMYEQAWYNFLVKNYDKCIEYANAFLQSPNLNKQDVPDFFAYRLLGFSYDMKNDRAAALESYKKGKAAMAEKKMKEEMVNSLLGKYETTPFVR